MNTRIHLALGAGVLALILSLGAAHAAGVDPSGGLTGPWLIGAGTQEDQIVSALKDANYAKAVAARTFGKPQVNLPAGLFEQQRIIARRQLAYHQ